MVLIVRNSHLSEQVIKIQKFYTEIPVGTKAPPIDGYGIGGGRVHVSFVNPSKLTLIFVLNSLCEYCDASWPTFTRVVQEISHRQAPRIIYIDLTNHMDEGYLSQHGIDRELVVREIDPTTQIGYRFSVTPQLIAVDQRGIVRGVWTGQLEDRDANKIRSRTLP